MVMAVKEASINKNLSATTLDDNTSSAGELDPRIHVELEKLNRTSEQINRLESELDEARANFRQMLSESTQQLNGLAKKLGSCVEKSRPYYESRLKAKELQLKTQDAAFYYEKACGQLTAAKEMVTLAEEGFFKKGQPFDPVWQEMLNHSTAKVNEAELERTECEAVHRETAQLYYDAEKNVKKIQKELKSAVRKSKSYFEMKVRVHQDLEMQKRRVTELEKLLVEAKAFYARALSTLEQISDEIHQQRKDSSPEKQKPLVQNSSAHFTNQQMGGVLKSVSDTSVRMKRSYSIPDSENHKSLCGDSSATNHSGVVVLVDNSTHKAGVSGSSGTVSDEYARSFVANPHIVIKESSPGEINEKVTRSVPDIQTASEDLYSANNIVESDRKLTATGGYLTASASSRDDADISDSESVAESLASTSMIADEQIESLMTETNDYQTFLSTMNADESKKWKRLSLPSKLSYLQKYVHLDMDFTDDNCQKASDICDAKRNYSSGFVAEGK